MAMAAFSCLLMPALVTRMSRKDSQHCAAEAWRLIVSSRRRDYDDVEEIMSGFRAALTADLESRRKRSIVWSIIDLRKNRKTKADLEARLSRLQINNPGPHALL